MSRHESPLDTPHNLVQMYRRLPPSAAEAVSKFKVKGHVAGITAGAEDVKYQAKYKELKKKVKEIESVCRVCVASSLLGKNSNKALSFV